MRWLAALAVIGLPVAGVAADWQALDGGEIAAALTGRVLVYAGATQEFLADGRTIYTTTAASHGRWRVEGEMYCSQWPPSESWACYTVSVSGEGGVRFVAPGGDVTEGRYAE